MHAEVRSRESEVGENTTAKLKVTRRPILGCKALTKVSSWRLTHAVDRMYYHFSKINIHCND
jgi:hypothetical protein